MALEKYNQKRNFKKTREPKGIKKASKGKLRFVVQKHAASHLHYDFRLEIDGVLASWAVPKGLSANPADRRLAIHVEDHPMDYIDFEGTIPQGEYGGGTVMVWDIGTYQSEDNTDVSKDNALMKKQLHSGAIKVILNGGKLKGSWHLIKMIGENEQWLLIKGKDEFAGKNIEYNPHSILTQRDFDEIAKQIKFSGFTKTGSMRHPAGFGLREDKAPEKEKTTVATKTKKTQVQTSTAKILNTTKFGRVEFTNTDKLFWPKEKITKGDVIAYYDAIADYILPYLKDRPESLRRTPDGIKSQGFFQKNVAGAVPEWIKTKKIKSDSAETTIEWLLCNDKETLLFLANYGCIEINPWSSRVGSLNNPDYIIFDLDPKGAPTKYIVTTVLKTKEILDNLKVPAYIKTSGGNGIHVFIPIGPKYTYGQTRDFSQLISQMVHRDLPDITSLERMPNRRKGKVYLDFLQNSKGKTMASIYSLRPREGAGVSTPLEWDEINDSLDLKAFNIHTVPKRLAEKGDLWKDFFKAAINLKAVLKNI